MYVYIYSVEVFADDEYFNPEGLNIATLLWSDATIEFELFNPDAKKLPDYSWFEDVLIVCSISNCLTHVFLLSFILPDS